MSRSCGEAACSYGDGITYWPVVEVLKQLLGSAPEQRLAGLGLDASAARAIQAVLGEGGVVASVEEIAWAMRMLLEAVAADAPLVVVLDDIHWGEEAFLDLVDHVADLSRDAPILLLCMARPELLDRRPNWGGGKLNATTVLLEPLAAADADALVASLLDGAPADDALRARILNAAEGNPLFVEEMVALVRESPDAAVAVPATIQALLAARLDQLDPVERDVLGRGSVEGRVFHRGAVQALSPDGSQLVAPLTALVRQGTAAPGRAAVSGRGRLSLPPPADPRRGLRGAPEGDPRRPARALRRLDRRACRRSRRARRGRRLPPRAGVPLPGRARPCG